MASLLRKSGPFQHKNLRLFAWFQIFFSARFYYPILAILFLDLGLTLDQFVILNAIWAATIFLAEVPSGALADIIGRKRLVVTAATLMILEMLVLLVAPQDAGWTLFTLCAVNRVLSGLSEAAASGADEALAYDTLEEKGEKDSWDDALATSMQWRSAAMIFAVIIGAASYDPAFLNSACRFLGFDTEFTQAETLRIPIALCFLQAIFAFFTTLRMRDPDTDGDRQSWSAVWGQTLQAAKWVFSTRAALVIIVGGLVIDSIARNFATINSSYFRLISLPESIYGLIAAGTSVLGIAIPKLAKKLARKYSLITNYGIAAVWVLLCLIALIPAWTYWGVIPAIILMGSLSFTGFIVSRSLNDITSSSQRATVLSVKGLLFNFAYGAMSLLFSVAVWAERQQLKGQTAHLEDAAFKAALAWQPIAFLITFLAFALFARKKDRLL